MDIKKKYFKTISEQVIKSIEKRNMAANYFDNSLIANEFIMKQIPVGAVVAWGGSQTLTECGLMAKLKTSGLVLLDRDSASNPEERAKVQIASFGADFYFMSTSAITLDGKLVNIDGNGNRLAAMIYGPKKVFIVAGINKVTENEETAMSRIRTIASPMNVQRLNRNTPCHKTGSCQDCLSPDCICSQIVITRRSMQKDRIHVILIGEELGY